MAKINFITLGNLQLNPFSLTKYYNAALPNKAAWKYQRIDLGIPEKAKEGRK
jgi:hypothetical protein